MTHFFSELLFLFEKHQWSKLLMLKTNDHSVHGTKLHLASATSARIYEAKSLWVQKISSQSERVHMRNTSKCSFLSNHFKKTNRKEHKSGISIVDFNKNPSSHKNASRTWSVQSFKVHEPISVSAEMLPWDRRPRSKASWVEGKEETEQQARS